MIVLRPEEMRRMDEQTIEEGYPEILLMEAAGRGIAELYEKRISDKSDENEILIFCGKGNNGGDGLVAARYLDMWKYNVKIILTGKEKDLQGINLKNYRICQMRNMSIIETDNTDLAKIEKYIHDCEVIIDGMLGTGLKGKVRGIIADIIDIINNNPSTEIISVDIPTGINGLDGKVLGKAIKADYTGTMAFKKIGLCVYPGRKYSGKIEVIDIGMPEKTSIDQVEYDHYMLNDKEAGKLLPSREETGHKGTFGRIGIIGGSRGMEGAPFLSGHASLKTGAGLVKLAVPENILPTISSFAPELITYGLPDDNRGIIKNDFSSVKEFLKDQKVVAVGPGIGRTETVSEIVNQILQYFEGPVVVDADGINVLNQDILKDREAPLILTPHPGEMSRLINQEIQQIQNNRISTARDFALKYNVYLVLKGAATIIAFPNGQVYINPTGNEGMATAGSGDVLTGMITGLISQKMDYGQAIVLAVYLHGLAGNFARNRLSSYSLNAGDIIEYIPEAFKYLQNL